MCQSTSILTFLHSLEQIFSADKLGHRRQVPLRGKLSGPRLHIYRAPRAEDVGYILHILSIRTRMCFRLSPAFNVARELK